jgi:LmbE family N-acetylglucosaminyl deacetylase
MIVLAIGAHPDDIELGCAGTIAKHAKNGDQTYFIIMSYGEMGGCPKERRKSEAEKSGKLLGVKKIFFLDLPDTNISYTHDTIDKIERVIAQVKPDRIYTHSSKDIHQDHLNTALASLTAARRTLGVFSYEGPSIYPSFSPQLYVNVEETLRLKLRAIKFYSSQSNKAYMESNAVKGLAGYRGLQVRLKYAEAFEIVRTIML